MTGAHCGGPIRFDDGEAYERFMGRWSRAVGSRFLDWLAPAGDSHWLEAGCGTGAFTPLVSERCRPAAIVAFDPTPQQIAYARHHLLNKCVAFHVAAAEAIPFADSSYDIVVSALAMNFMRDCKAAVREMRARVPHRRMDRWLRLGFRRASDAECANGPDDAPPRHRCT